MSNQKTNKTLKKKSLTGHRTIKNNKQNLNNTTEEMEQLFNTDSMSNISTDKI